MPKSQYADPNFLRAPGYIQFKDIPVNQYNKSIADERANFSDEELVTIFSDMVMLREYETMINLIKTTSEYHGIPYNHPGPAHLSMGQEAAAVGQAFALTIDDYSFGSHRSHGEVLARGLRAIHTLPEDQLDAIMKNYMDGTIYKIIENEFKGLTDIRAFAEHFFLYGAMAEMFARETGFQKGLGGSMHAFFTPFGIYPNNAIVGGSAGVAVGAAMYKHINRKPGIVVANIGDGSLGCGPVWEALCLATMDQYKQLWGGEYQGGIPFLFNVFNNQYGMGGQTRGETMGYDFAARLGAGVNPDQLYSERVDGYNPLAVIDATRRQKAIIEAKKGPAMLDVVTYRYAGHSPSDSSSYREKAEIEAWEAIDPLKTYRAALVEAGVAEDSVMEGVQGKVFEELEHILKMAIDEKISPRMDLVGKPESISSLMFSNEKVAKMEDREPEVNMPKEECPRVQQIAKKERFGIKDGKPVSKNKAYNFRDGVFEAVIDKFYEDPTLITYGEDVRDWGGAFAVYRGLTEALPYQRLFNSPISEAAIIAAAVGYGMCGGRVIAEIMYCDFIGRAGDELFNQLAKWHAMSAGTLKMPVIVRVSVGSKYGAQHSQDWTSLCAHIPGLKVCFPVTPYDAKGMMAAALEGTDPVIFFESQRLYDISEQFHTEGVPAEHYEIELGEPDVKRAGKDITILSIGSTLYRVTKAADMLKEKYGIEAEIIDARSIVPFNYEKVIESVKKTGRILLTSDACDRGSYLKDMAQTISELCFDYLDAPPVVVGARNWITPAHEIEDFFFPQPEWMLDAINEKILPLPGHVATANFTANETIRRDKLGV